MQDKHEPKCGILDFAEVCIIFFRNEFDIKLRSLSMIIYLFIYDTSKICIDPKIEFEWFIKWRIFYYFY